MATENPAKKLKVDAPMIGTHNGHFHADESLAVAMLRLLPTYLDSPLVRTRDPAVLSTCHTVVDVGGEYDDGNKRYDHHQRGFETVFPGHNTKLSSAGLVYLHFGRDIITAVTGLQGQDRDILFEKIYTDFIEAFDANDNGVNVIAPKDLEKAGLEKKFEDRGFSIASVVNRYNFGTKKSATAEEARTPEAKQAEENMRFEKASQFVGEQFEMELTDRANWWLPARHQVKQAYDARLQYDPRGRILVLPEGMPWSDHLYSLEKEVPIPEGQQQPTMQNISPQGGMPQSGMPQPQGVNMANMSIGQMRQQYQQRKANLLQTYSGQNVPPQYLQQMQQLEQAIRAREAQQQNQMQQMNPAIMQNQMQGHNGVAPQVLYVLFPEDKPEGKWRIRAVSKENGGFENRKDLPDAWKGVRDEQLDQVSGIPGCVFVHAAGFIGGNKSFDGALAMAKKALEL